ncbi:MAG: PfkB family carbohydrate kinase, partial [Rhodobacter sp.]|nr:PfkB family carbohydrate kinase [Rhodobacter sp.]
MKVACIGEAMVELALAPGNSGQAQVGFAGDTLNTAVYLKRSAPALEVSFVTRLGHCGFSARMVDFIAAEGL